MVSVHLHNTSPLPRCLLSRLAPPTDIMDKEEEECGFNFNLEPIESQQSVIVVVHATVSQEARSLTSPDTSYQMGNVNKAGFSYFDFLVPSLFGVHGHFSC